MLFEKLELWAFQKVQKLSYKLKTFHFRDKKCTSNFQKYQGVISENKSMVKLSFRGQMHLLFFLAHFLKVVYNDDKPKKSENI